MIIQDNSCKAFNQISWGVEDTDGTIDQVRRHNRTYAALCPKKKKAEPEDFKGV